MSDVEKTFEEVRAEVMAKVELAVATLREASDLAASNTNILSPKGMDDYDDLRDIVSQFIDLYPDQGWSSSANC